MTTALIGLVGALVGLLIGSSYTFWATRRSELAAALVAASVLAEELRALRDQARVRPQSDFTRLQVAWDDHRPSLMRHMAPEYFQRLTECLPRERDTRQSPLEEAIETMDALTDLFWKEYAAFIVVPLINYLRRDTLSQRVPALFDSTLIRENTDSRGPAQHPAG